MGTSAVIFQNKGFWCEDGTLESWLYLLANEIEKLDSIDPWLQRLYEHWRVQSSGVGMGVIHTGLDDHLDSREHIDQIIAIIKQAKVVLSEYGDTIPTDHLNNIDDSENYDFSDVPTEPFIIVGEHFEALLNGTLVVDTNYGEYGRRIQLTR